MLVGGQPGHVKLFKRAERVDVLHPLKQTAVKAPLWAPTQGNPPAYNHGPGKTWAEVMLRSVHLLTGNPQGRVRREEGAQVGRGGGLGSLPNAKGVQTNPRGGVPRGGIPQKVEFGHFGNSCPKKVSSMALLADSGGDVFRPSSKSRAKLRSRGPHHCTG